MNQEVPTSTELRSSLLNSPGDPEFQRTTSFSEVDTNYYSEKQRVPVKRSTSKGTLILVYSFCSKNHNVIITLYKQVLDFKT